MSEGRRQTSESSAEKAKPNIWKLDMPADAIGLGPQKGSQGHEYLAGFGSSTLHSWLGSRLGDGHET